MTDSLFQLIARVLDDHAPQERGLFEAVGRNMIQGQLDESGGSPGSTLSMSPEFEAGLVFGHIIAGTLSVVEMYVSARRVREEKKLAAQLQAVWEQQLIRWNVPPTLARLASEERGPELLSILASLDHHSTLD